MAPRYARMRPADPAAARAATCGRVCSHLSSGDRVLEPGCGTGPAAIRLVPAVAEHRASDLSPGMVAIARARPGGQDLRHLRFRVPVATAPADPPVDAVLASTLPHRQPDPPAALAAIRAQRRPGGLFLS